MNTIVRSLYERYYESGGVPEESEYLSSHWVEAGEKLLAERDAEKPLLGEGFVDRARENVVTVDGGCGGGDHVVGEPAGGLADHALLFGVKLIQSDLRSVGCDII